ncbi:MFS transporter [Acetobacter sp. TBRC 12305]|uniref:MFS transporter n=1 Tax=Acetobacter garciniae TaxID=2817435 RepID=A0A939HQL9_9PROT|nr:MFS transporter [Acetobacter garciniae]MBO1326654.1 MFS transporter [Acetobacter garciniae]MBX0345051.1 MFS transporter [Acetobacter garciniae]
MAHAPSRFPAGAVPASPVARRVLVAACVGNFLEFYNFMAFAFFAPMIGQAFFPSGNHLASLLHSLMTFAVGFFLRPFGALVVGWYGRRYGQRAALMLTFSLMGAGSLLLALAPTTATIGLLAPVLIIVARMMQGFSDGGEVGPATALIVEAAPQGLGGVFAAMQSMTQLLGSLAGVVVGLVLSLTLSQDALYAWGWRVPFVLGLVIVPLGLALRASVAASGAASGAAAGTVAATVADSAATRIAGTGTGVGTTGAPARPRLDSAERGVLRRVVPLVFLCITSGTIITYVEHFGVSYAVAVLHLSPSIGMAGMAAGLVTGAVALGVGMATLARKPDPRPYVLAVGLVMAMASVPLYRLAIQAPGLGSMLLLNVTLFGLTGLGNACIWRTQVEALPARSRSFVFGIVYALAVSSFGGLTQPFVTWLVAVTANPMMPGYLMVAAVFLGLGAYMLLYRTIHHPAPTGDGTPARCKAGQDETPPMGEVTSGL